MGRLYLAELRDSWTAWLGVSLSFFAINLSFVSSALVLASGWAAADAGLTTVDASGEFTSVPFSNFLFSGIVGLTVIAAGTGLVIDSRRGGLARLALAGASPRQITRSIMVQLAAVSVLSALVADIVAVLTLEPYLTFLATGTEAGADLFMPPPVIDVTSMLTANLGVVAVALIGGLGQARRAAAIPPVEALRQASALSAPRMTPLRWIGAVACLLLLAAMFGLIWPMTEARNSETVSMLMQVAIGALMVSVTLVTLLAPVLIGPLARAWTALLPIRDPMWQLARKNVYVRGARFSRSVVPIVFTIGLMLGLLSLAPTLYATTEASGYPGGAISLSRAGLGAFLSLLGPALGVALCGGIGNLFMMSKQRDAELALAGIAGATPAQRRSLPILEAIILTVTASMPGVVALGIMLAHLWLTFQRSGLVPVVSVPGIAWAAGIGGTGLIMVAATFLPTLGALGLPEPRVIARLVAE